MSRDSLTTSELIAVRQFVRAWREAITETGAVDFGYMHAAGRRPDEYRVVREVTRRSPAWYRRLDAICSAGDLDRLLPALDMGDTRGLRRAA